MSTHLRINTRRIFARRTERVNSVELHPTKHWILTSFESGSVVLWDLERKIILKELIISEKIPVNSAKFVARKDWVVCDAELIFIDVYNSYTWERVERIAAHADGITSIIIHHRLPYLISASADWDIKIWDWENHWAVRTISGNSGVGHISFCPGETTAFASVCLNGVLKIWSFDSLAETFSIIAHQKAINCVCFFCDGNKTYLITGSKDHTAKVWDCETRSCIQILNHESPVSSVCFYPEPPVIITGSEDGELRIWNSKTYRLERTIDHGLNAVRAIYYSTGSKRVLIGYDEGIIMLELDRELPVPSMDAGGNIFTGKNNMIQRFNTKAIVVGSKTAHGELLSFPVKELGMCGIYPQMLQHNSNGKYVALSGDGMFAIYNTAPEWQLRLSAAAENFAWSARALEFAIRESAEIRIFRSFQLQKTLRPECSVECIFGGSLLSLCSEGFVCFYDWTECELIHKFHVNVRNVHWKDGNDLIAIDSDAAFYILKYKKGSLACPKQEKTIVRGGSKGALELVYTINERVRTGVWAKDCFVYINSSWCLKLCTDGVVTNMCNLNGIHYLDRPMNLVGYNANQSQVYLVDKALNFVRYRLPQISNDSMTPEASLCNKVGLHDVCRRMKMQDDFEFSWKDELLNGQYILSAVRNQGATSTCVFQSISAAADMTKMRAAAGRHPSETTDIRFSASSFVSDYEKMAGAIPLETKTYKRLRDGLKLFETQGVYAQGGGATPRRYRISSSRYNVGMSFGDVSDLILQGRPVIGSIRVDQKFGELNAYEIYDGPDEEEETFKHCVVFVGFGQRDDRKYLVFLNSHGTEFSDKGFGRVYFEHAKYFSTLEF